MPKTVKTKRLKLFGRNKEKPDEIKIEDRNYITDCVHCKNKINKGDPCVIHTKRGDVKGICAKCLDLGFDWDGLNGAARKIKSEQLLEQKILASSQSREEAVARGLLKEEDGFKL